MLKYTQSAYKIVFDVKLAHTHTQTQRNKKHTTKIYNEKHSTTYVRKEIEQKIVQQTNGKS